MQQQPLQYSHETRSSQREKGGYSKKDWNHKLTLWCFPELQDPQKHVPCASIQLPVLFYNYILLIF